MLPITQAIRAARKTTFKSAAFPGVVFSTCIHTIKLVHLHKALHQLPEETLQLHGLTLHSNAPKIACPDCGRIPPVSEPIPAPEIDRIIHRTGPCPLEAKLREIRVEKLGLDTCDFPSCSCDSAHGRMACHKKLQWSAEPTPVAKRESDKKQQKPRITRISRNKGLVSKTLEAAMTGVNPFTGKKLTNEEKERFFSL